MDLITEHQECQKIFEKLFDTEDGNSVACDIWRVMVGEGEKYDNCIGENFNQLLFTIKSEWFGNESMSNTSIEFYCTTYLLWLYLVVSRAYEILDALNPKQTNDFIEKKRISLQAFNEINLWAKFIKHPKEFIFCHWPEHSCEGQVPHKQGEKTIITTSYLKNHYSSEKDKRPVVLKNNISVVVQYPKLARITEGFVNDFLAFRNFICKNDMLVEELKKYSNVPININYPDNSEN